ncbi:hypothetical protein D3C81_2161110 [compost metagenome]
MVAFQPDVIQIFEAVIFGNLLRWKMAVVVENRLVFGVVMVQTASKFGVEQEIFGHKRSHYRLPL